MDRKAAILISMGFEIIGVVIVAIYVGGYLDDKYHWGGLGLVGMIVLGFIGWLTHVLLAVRSLDKTDADNDEKLAKKKNSPFEQ